MVESINQIEANFQGWMSRLSEKWDMTPEDIANHLDAEDGEIQNRVTWYPKLAFLLARKDWTLTEFKGIASQCYVLNGRFQAIRLNQMLENEHAARLAIDNLVRQFPENTLEIVQLIDDFVSSAVQLGYTTPSKTADYAGAASLASVLLSAFYSRRFVDFRLSRWIAFARMLKYPDPPAKPSYGEKLVWAGEFAENIVQTPTFKQFWLRYGEPLWVISGLCWHGPEPKKPSIVEESFPEGRIKEEWHKGHERNRKVVEQAKQRAFSRDPMLRCEVCGFSFLERYGEAGEKTIEAHHKTPIALLTQAGRTRVEEIALLCSNCHRMVHSGSHTRSLDELRKMLR